MVNKYKNKELNNRYCQQHVCEHISTCTRSWKNMPRDKRFLCEEFKPDKDGVCEYFTTEILNIKEVE